MLVVEELGKTFGGLTALFGIDFEVEKGSITGIIGPNGAGKTTMFNLISGAFLPTSGSIRFKGRDITEIRSDKVCRMGISRTYQNAKPFEALSVLQNVLIGIFYGRKDKPDLKRARSEAMDILRFLDLEGDADALADAIAELLLDPDRCQELGERGRKAIFEKFNVDKTAAEMVRTYGEIAQKFA